MNRPLWLDPFYLLFWGIVFLLPPIFIGAVLSVILEMALDLPGAVHRLTYYACEGFTIITWSACFYFWGWQKSRSPSEESEQRDISNSSPDPP
jgi:hypothetical protein